MKTHKRQQHHTQTVEVLKSIKADTAIVRLLTVRGDYTNSPNSQPVLYSGALLKKFASP